MGTQVISVWQGDFGYSLIFNLQDIQGNVFSLVGATSVLFRAQLIGTAKTIVNGTMAVTNAAGGVCSYTVAAGDFALAGEYAVQIQVNFSTTETITFGNLQVTANPKIPY